MSEPIDNRPNEVQLAEIETLLRRLGPADVDQTMPPEDVWDGITTRLATERHEFGQRGVPMTAPDDELRPPALIVPIHRRQQRFGRSQWLAAAAVVVVVGAGAAIARRNDGRESVVATARLTWDSAMFDPAGADAAATVKLVERDGEYELQLTDTRLSEPTAESADLELWLIALDTSGTPSDLVPIALITASSPGTYAIPDGVDPTVNTIVDISIEPRDGNEQHSGRSILRGELA